MNKVISFELKKLVSRPAIYILALCLAILLTVSAVMYKPIEEKKVYNTLDGNTVSAINTDFKNNYQSDYDLMVAENLNLANIINSKNATEFKNEIDVAYTGFLNTSNDYVNNYAFNATVSDAKKTEQLANIQTKLINLKNVVISMLGDENNSYFKALITKKNYTSLISNFDKINIAINQVLTNENRTSINHQNLAQKLAGELSNNLKKSIDTITYPNYSNIVKKYLIDGNYYVVTVERQEIIMRQIAEILTTVSTNPLLEQSKKLINQYNDLFNEYRLVSQMYVDAFTTELNIVCLESITDTERDNIKYFKDSTIYKEKEHFTRLKFYIEHDKTEYDYATNLSFDYASNDKANGFDYSYFALSIFSVLVMAFAIMLASHTIAGESREGNLRFTAIRPVTRTSLFFGKFFAIAIISLILLIFSSIATIIVGGFSFGLSSHNLLTIINASQVVVMHPSLALIIFVASTYLQILVYVSIAMLISLICKSDLFAVISTILLYLVNLLLPLFFGTNSWLKYYPLTSLNLYAYIGAGSKTADSLLGMMFSAKIYSHSTIWISVLFITLLIGICNAIAIHIFKKKEL